MIEDYPAAHSMDTTWFAVDAEGNIGLFDSGENGAVPNHRSSKGSERSWVGDIDYLLFEWSLETEERVIHLNIPATEILNKLHDCLIPDLSKRESTLQSVSVVRYLSGLDSWLNKLDRTARNFQEFLGWGDWSWLLLITGDEYPVYQKIKSHGLKRWDYIVQFEGEPRLIFLKTCPMTTIKMLFQQGLIQEALPLYRNRYSKEKLLGLFSYAHDYGYPNPYECDRQPLYPLNLDDLPEKLQDWVSWNWFDRVKFSEHPKIQPIEHMRCHTWRNEKWWMDCEGNEREGHPYD